jgi:multidrug/hemolysin transport system ATP-binding protein
MIEVRNLSKTYDNKVLAVDDISFSVNKGEIFAFLGENGAGKTTTINILCTMLKKDKGSVRINGFDLDKHDADIRKSIGVVFQGSYLDDRLTVAENLASRGMLYGYSAKEIKERIDLVSKRLNMDSYIKRRYGQLSGGQKRRADIARAILHTPKLLFLDEPTTGLDPATRHNVWQTIKEIQEQTGMTIFFSTHYMEETEIATRVAIIKKGRIAVMDTPYVLKQKYSFDTLNLFSEDLTAITNYLQENKYEYRINNDYVVVRLKNSLHALPIIDALSGKLDSFEVMKGNMDTVFIAVNGEGENE